jgi:ribosomal-protein-alanine N-acetyltransferase
MRWWDVQPARALEDALFPDPWSAETFWSELAGVPATRHYLVAEAPEAAGTRLLGYAGLFATRHEADVQTLAVAPAAQGSGVGSLLLAALLAEAARRGCPSVLLEVRADNLPAHRLYRRHGFQRVAVRRGYYRPGPVDAWVLRRRL